MILIIKAKLVTKDFSQNEIIFYFDAYAHLARWRTIRVLFTLASLHNLYVPSNGSQNGILKWRSRWGYLHIQWADFLQSGNEHKVWKLVKSLHKLKQTPKKWHVNGFVHNVYDKCLYIKVCGEIVIYVCLYVNH